VFLDQLVEFGRHFGSEIDLAVEQEGRFVFYGPVDLTSVETVDDQDGQLLMGFTFQRALEADELVALGLQA
jgi:hypothetical protein